MNVIYIIEPEDYAPNFITNDGKGEWDKSIVADKTKVAKNLALSAASFGLSFMGPIGLVASAAAASPMVRQFVLGTNKNVPEEQKDAAREMAYTAIDVFIRKHGVTLKSAKDLNYKFPPGHPQINQVYKLHPLAEFDGSGKINVYIPQDKYDELLLQEREAELIKVLVELGAVKVSITKNSANLNRSNLSGEISAGAKTIGNSEIKSAISAVDTAKNLDCREFELTGKTWHQGDKLNKSSFAWVHFEPSWEALIFAREIGDCTKAAVEIRENTSFSSDKTLSATVKSKLYEGSASVASTVFSEDENVYLVSAEFSPSMPLTDSVQ